MSGRPVKRRYLIGHSIFDTLYSKIEVFRKHAGADEEHTVCIEWLEANFPSVHCDVVGEERDTVLRWCQDSFGNEWIWSHDLFSFIHERDAMLFALRWVNESTSIA